MQPNENQSPARAKGSPVKKLRAVVQLSDAELARLTKLADADCRRPGSLARLFVMRGIEQMERGTFK